ncbi:MAG TPA: hypothetical protein VFX05_01200 [Casimicrobiaceae bacterium]|nr:hypothetical protein [Casimicrobiaceae bacterium]
MAAFVLLAPAAPVAEARKTVCAITINSPDERDIFRRALPAEEFDVVELVERGRPDWLDAACRNGIRCDALVVSGHFDGGVEFYSDRLDQRESLPVEAMERAACSAGCPGLFASLKEVYLFGCNTLNPDGTTSAAAEVERGLRRAGHSAEDAARVAALLNERHARSNRDRMRQLFKDVPVLYGFSGKAPLGHVAGPALEKHLQSPEARRDVASGRVNAELLRRFAPVSMTVAAGATDADPLAAHRRDVCGFADARPPLAAKAALVHGVLQRDMGQVRMLLDPLEAFVSGLPSGEARTDDTVDALQAIAQDGAARERFLAYARSTDDARTRARMIDVAHGLRWLDDGAHRAEMAALLKDRLAARASVDDIDLACRLNGDGRLDPERSRLGAATPGTSASAAVLACLGDASGRQAVLDALAGGRDEDVAAAEVLLHHRPVASAEEFRTVADRLHRIASPEAQARTLEMLAKRPFVDDATFASLAKLFPSARSLAVQRAIAALLIRADYRGTEAAWLARLLREHRIRSTDGRDVIDVLIRRLGAQG